MSRAQRRLIAYLDRLEPSVRRDVERALLRLRRRVSIDQLIAAVERGDQVALARIAAIVPRDLQRATAALARAAAAGSRVASAMVRGSFAITNERAVAVAERQAALLVSGITRESRKAIRTAVAEAIAGRLSARDAATVIRPLIGLTERQTKAVLRQRKADRARGLTAAQIAARAARYTERLRRSRAEMIARTEIIAAATEGQLDVWRQAQADGQLSPNAKKRWMVTPDDRLCPRCSALDGATAAISGTFQEGGRRVSGPPLHVQCRCTLVIDAKSIRARAAA